MADIFDISDLLNSDALDRDGEVIEVESTVSLDSKVVVEKSDGSPVQVPVSTILEHVRNAAGLLPFSDMRISPNRVSGNTLPTAIRVHLGDKLTTHMITSLTFQFAGGQLHTAAGIPAIEAAGEWGITLSSTEVTNIASGIQTSDRNLSATLTFGYNDGTSASFVLYMSVNDASTEVTEAELDVERGRITALESSVSTESGRIDTLSSALTTLDAELTAEKGRTDALEARPIATTGGTYPGSPKTGAIHLFDRAVSSLANTVGMDGSTAKTSALDLDVFRYDGTNWVYIGFLGVDGVVTNIELLDGHFLRTTRSIGSNLDVDLSPLRHIDLIAKALVSFDDNDLDINVQNHTNVYGDRDQYEFRSPITNTGPVRLQVRASIGGSLVLLGYKSVLEIHGHEMVAGTIHEDDLISLRYDDGIDAFIANVYPPASLTDRGVLTPELFSRIEAAVEKFDALPDPDTHKTGDVVFVDGKFYIHSTAPGVNIFGGVIGTSIDHNITKHGVQTDTRYVNAVGRWTSNPDNTLLWMTADTDANQPNINSHTSIAIKQSVYRAAKGSNEATGDTVSAVITVGSNAAETFNFTIRSFNLITTAHDGTVYLIFNGTAPHDSAFVTNDGEDFTLKIQKNGSDFITHSATAHWVEYPLSIDGEQLQVTVGGVFPSHPVTRHLHLFDATASSLTNTVGTDGTTPKTTAKALDLFRFNGTAWQFVGFIGNTNTNTNTQLTDEQVQDKVAAFIQEGSNITTTYDDAAGTLTISSTGGTGADASQRIWTEGRDPVAGDGNNEDIWIRIYADERAEIWEKISGNWVRLTGATKTTVPQRIFTQGRDPVAGDGVDEDIWIRIYADERAEIWEKVSGNWVRLTSATQLTDEQLQDKVAAFLQEGSNITTTYDDAAGTLTIASTGGGGDATANAPYSIFTINAGITVGAEGATPVALGFVETPMRTHNATGIIARDATEATEIDLEPGTYEITNHFILAPANLAGTSRANFNVQIYDGTNVLDEKGSVGYLRGSADLDSVESFDSHHIITLTAATTIQLRIGAAAGGAGYTGAATAAGGTMDVRLIGSAIPVSVDADIVRNVHTTSPTKARDIGADEQGNFYVSESEIGSDAQGTWTKAVIPNYDDAYETRPAVGTIGDFYYDYSEHAFFQAVAGNPNYWSRVTPSDVFLVQGDTWLGEFNTEADALADIDPFVNTLSYFAFFDDQINELTNGTYVAATSTPTERWIWRRVAGEEAARIAKIVAELYDEDGESALQLAIAALARLDALDVRVDGDVTPVATYNIDDTTALAGAGGAALFTHNITSLQATDLVVMEWENFVFNGASYEHSVAGSSDAHGRAYFSAGDLGIVPVQGRIGRTTDVVRKASDNSGDTLGSHLALSAVWNSQFSRIEVHGDKTISGTANDIALLPPAGFTFKFSVYRNVTLTDALEGSLHTQIKELQENWGTVNGLKVLTSAAYTALATKDSTTLYILVG